MTPRSFSALLALALTLAAPVAAQTIPMVIPDDPEAQMISVVVDKGVTSTRSLPRPLRETRQAMIDKEPVSDEALRALAERRDGLAAKRYADRLARKGIAANASDLAFFYSISAGTGQVYALRPMVEAMAYLDPETEPASRMNQLISVLYPYAWAGNSIALDAVIEFNGEGKLFGALSDATRQRIMRQAETGNGRVELRMGLDILSAETKSAADLDRAETYLSTAEASPVLGVKVTAQNLLPFVARQRAALAGTANN